MMRLTIPFILTFLALPALMPAGALAQTDSQTDSMAGDAAAGRQLAASQCSSCHAGTGAPAQNDTVQADIPSFSEIANRADQSAERIDSMLMVPSHPMPLIQLTRAERANLAAFILSLREE